MSMDPQQPHQPQQPQWQPTNPPAPPAPVAKPNWFMRHKILTGLLGLVLFGMVLSSLGGGGADTAAPAADTTAASGASAGGDTATKAAEEKPAEEQKEESPKAAAIGTKVRDGKFEFVVTKVESGKTSVGDQYLNETAQGQFTLVSVTVTNIGEEPQFLSDSNQKVKDGQGREFSPNSSAGIYIKGNDVLFNEINPGNTVKGVLVYDMPKGAKPASIELHDSAFSGGVTVKLG